MMAAFGAYGGLNDCLLGTRGAMVLRTEAGLMVKRIMIAAFGAYGRSNDRPLGARGAIVLRTEARLVE